MWSSGIGRPGHLSIRHSIAQVSSPWALTLGVMQVKTRDALR
jgi:hypothetical protein